MNELLLEHGGTSFRVPHFDGLRLLILMATMFPAPTDHSPRPPHPTSPILKVISVYTLTDCNRKRVSTGVWVQVYSRLISLLRAKAEPLYRPINCLWHSMSTRNLPGFHQFVSPAARGNSFWTHSRLDGEYCHLFPVTHHQAALNGSFKVLLHHI